MSAVAKMLLKMIDKGEIQLEGISDLSKWKPYKDEVRQLLDLRKVG